MVPAEPVERAAPVAREVPAERAGRWCRRRDAWHDWPMPMPTRSWWTRSSTGAKERSSFPKSDSPFFYCARHCRRIEMREQMERWEPWVRAYTAIGEMLQGINSQDDRATRHSRSVSSGTSLIAEIGRPKETTFEAQIPYGAELGRTAQRTRHGNHGADRSAIRVLVVDRLHASRPDQANIRTHQHGAAVLRVCRDALQARAGVLASGRIQRRRCSR